MTTKPFPTERTAVVTGAGAPAGIARHVARTLAEQGWRIAAIDVSQDNVERFAAELSKETGKQVLGLGVDITDKDQVEEAFAEIDAKLPPVLAEANLAGIASPHSFFELTDEIWTRVMDVNAKGTLFMMQAAGRRMIEGGYGGRIVNTSSITAIDGGGTFSKTGYAAAKAAVVGLTRGGARELGPHGITCNAILPGPIDTEIMGGKLTEERKVAMSSDIPLGRVGQPQEVAALVAFLLSEAAGFINAGKYLIDGGKHMV